MRDVREAGPHHRRVQHFNAHRSSPGCQPHLCTAASSAPPRARPLHSNPIAREKRLPSKHLKCRRRPPRRATSQLLRPQRLRRHQRWKRRHQRQRWKRRHPRPERQRRSQHRQRRKLELRKEHVANARGARGKAIATSARPAKRETGSHATRGSATASTCSTRTCS